MAIDQETFNTRLYSLLKTRGYKPVPRNVNNERTTPQDAEVFEFTFKKGDDTYGLAWVTIDQASNLKVYYNDEQSNSPKGKTKGASFDDSWSGLLRHLKQWAQSKQLSFELQDGDRPGDDMRQRETNKKKEKMSEGYHAVNQKTSYNDNIPNVKVVIQHDRAVQEGEQRWRNVHKIFVENTEGERFAVPTRMPGIARVYGRHVAEGGTPYDDRGKHITSLVEEYTQMAGFVRATRKGQFNESVALLIAEGVNHHKKLKESLQKMQSHRGYNAYFESWTPPLMEDDGDSSSIAEMFTQGAIDPRIESVLPILNRLNSGIINEIEEVNELDQWAKSITEMVPIDENEDYGYRLGYKRQKYEKDLAMEFVKLPLASMSKEEIRSEMSSIFNTLYHIGMGDEPQTDAGVAMEDFGTSVEDSGVYVNDDWTYPAEGEISDEDVETMIRHQQIVNGILRLQENISDNKEPTIDKEMDSYFGSKPGELEEGKRDTHCSAKCCGADVKAEDCGCSPDCEHCNCNAKLDESGLQRYTGIKKYGKKGFEELQKAGREGASEEEKGKIKDKHLTKEETEMGSEDDDLRDEESGKNHDPKTGKRTKPHPFDPEDDHLNEGAFKRLEVDAMEMSEKEFAKKHPEMAHRYDDILAASSDDNRKDKRQQSELDLSENTDYRSLVHLDVERIQKASSNSKTYDDVIRQRISDLKLRMGKAETQVKRKQLASEIREYEKYKNKYDVHNAKLAKNAKDASRIEADRVLNKQDDPYTTPAEKVTIGTALAGLLGEESVIDEKDFSDKEIKMAYGILNDPRYKGGNQTGAIKAIEGIKAGLSEHPGVKRAIYKTQNEPDNLEENIKIGGKGFYVNIDPRTGEETPLSWPQYQSTWYDEFKDDPESRTINANKLSLKYQVYLDQLGDNLLEIQRRLARTSLGTKIQDKVQEFTSDLNYAKQLNAELKKEEQYRQADKNERHNILWNEGASDGNIQDIEDMLTVFKEILADHEGNGTTHWWQSFGHGDHLDTAVRDDIASELMHIGAWKGDLEEGLDANQKRVGQLGPVGGPAKVGDLVGAESKHANDEMSVSQMSDKELAEYVGCSTAYAKANRDECEEVANDKSADHAPDNMLEDILRLSGYDQYKGKSTGKGAGTLYKG